MKIWNFSSQTLISIERKKIGMDRNDNLGINLMWPYKVDWIVIQDSK